MSEINPLKKRNKNAPNTTKGHWGGVGPKKRVALRGVPLIRPWILCHSWQHAPATVATLPSRTNPHQPGTHEFGEGVHHHRPRTHHDGIQPLCGRLGDHPKHTTQASFYDDYLLNVGGLNGLYGGTTHALLPHKECNTPTSMCRRGVHTHNPPVLHISAQTWQETLDSCASQQIR